MVRDYESTILKELDLKLEASNTNLTRKNFLGSKELYIPEVYWDLTTSKSDGARKNRWHTMHRYC